jgi:hypothetical protein
VEGLAYTTALALALVLGVAGVAKLRRRGLTERSFRSQGLAWPRALATTVPVTEVVLAAGLVVVPSWAATATLAVLAGFTTFLVRSMRRGDPLGCGCFGATRAVPVGPTELVRNGVLMAAAALVTVAAESPTVPGPVPLLTVTVAAVGAVAALAQLRRRSRPGTPGPQGLAPGSMAPTLPGSGTAPVGSTMLVAFVAPSCEGCAELLVTLQQVPRADVAVRVIELTDDTAPLFAAYGVRSAPYLVVVDRQGRVRSSGPARSPGDVARLVANR